MSTEFRDTAALILAVLALAGVLAPACTVDMDRRERAEPGRSLESSTEPGRDITRLARDMARGSSTWFCSTTCRFEYYNNIVKLPLTALTALMDNVNIEPVY